MFVQACIHTHTHPQTNQYAEPEPLRSLITASFTAVGCNASFFSLQSAKKKGFPSRIICLKVFEKLTEQFNHKLLRGTYYILMRWSTSICATVSKQTVLHSIVHILYFIWSHCEQGQDAMLVRCFVWAWKQIFHQPAALFSPGKRKADFTCKDLSREDDLYHLCQQVTSVFSRLFLKVPVWTGHLILFESQITSHFAAQKILLVGLQFCFALPPTVTPVVATNCLSSLQFSHSVQHTVNSLQY